MLSLLAVAAVSLMAFSPARQAWQINAWSLQYARHALNCHPILIRAEKLNLHDAKPI